MEYEGGLVLIKGKRREIYSLSLPIAVSIFAGIGAQFIFAPLSPVFGALAFALFYKRLVDTAHLPCPKCNEPFGSKSNFVLDPGMDSCQNCGLGLDYAKS